MIGLRRSRRSNDQDWEAAVGTAAAHVRKPVLRPIRTRGEFHDAVRELDALANANPKEGSAAYDHMELLTILIAAYEDEHLPPPKPVSPQDVVRFMAEQKGIGQADLADLLGGRSRLSEFFNETRELSKAQILRLRDALGIPADLLLGS
jgi:HTH-type transcriptional regulator/antitoxin HigA